MSTIGKNKSIKSEQAEGFSEFGGCSLKIILTYTVQIIVLRLKKPNNKQTLT